MINIKSFTVIDFETANYNPYSICQVGLVKVENGKITEEIDILVKPPDNYFHYIFPGIHGITPQMTKDAPTFNKIWHLIKPHIHKQNVVAHNISFDRNCLKHALSYYKLKQPEYNEHCTYDIYGKGLSSCCRNHKIKLNHHNALSDAKACAMLFLLHLKNENKI
jgi:DNA polymerase-3 subunit epsilon